ncbi:hypothetical protein E4U12_005873 [Claviceps purpurea]|nr:hypothetical protein E4U12_005873 [Claviceps purpurea]
MASKHDGPMRFSVEPKYGGIEAPGRIRQTTRLPHVLLPGGSAGNGHGELGLVPKDAGRPDNATVSGFVAASSRRLRPSSSLPEVEDRKPETRISQVISVPHLMYPCRYLTQDFRLSFLYPFHITYCSCLHSLRAGGGPRCSEADGPHSFLRLTWGHKDADSGSRVLWQYRYIGKQ